MVQLCLVWLSCILYDVSLIAVVLTELSSFRLAILVVSFWELKRVAHAFRVSFLFFILLLRVEKIDLYDPLFLSRWAISLHSNPTERKLHP